MMKRLLKVTGLMMAVILSFSVLGGCGSQAAQSGSGAGEGEKAHLNFGCYNYSDSLDPATNVNSSWCGIRYGITECLFKFSDQVVAQPNICDDYTVTEDYKTWTLHIREGVKFSNGNDVTASAVMASIERLYAQTDGSRGGTGNSRPDGYLTYASISADEQAGTVTIVCDKPNSNIPGILAYPYFSIIDTSVADQEIIGTGPYKVKKVEGSISMELQRNEHYWNGEVPYESVTILFINDSSTKAMALQSGDVDLVENITTASDLEKLAAADQYYISTASGVRTGNSYMNFKGVLSNEILRQAIIMAIDRDTMCKVTVAGMYTPGISVLPSSLTYNYDKLKDPFPYDKEKAIALLDEAGIVDHDGDGWRELEGRNIELNSIAYSSRNLNEFAEAVALQLSEIGIKVNVSIRDYDTALALQNAGEFDMITSNALTVSTGDPVEFLGNWYSGHSASYGFYANPEYDAVYEELLAEMDGGRRTELIARLQQILIDDASNTVYGYYNSRMISNAQKVSGAEIATMDYYWLTTDIKPAE